MHMHNIEYSVACPTINKLVSKCNCANTLLNSIPYTMLVYLR